MKKSFFLLLIVICMIISGCIEDPYKKIEFKDGRSYFVYEHTSDGSFRVNGIDLSDATMEQIRNIKSDTIPSQDFTATIIETPEQAAELGAEILNSAYENWTYDNHIVVAYNDVANVWVIHGQSKDRNTTQKVGYVVFDATDGETVCINRI